ncbi:hypothetical protein PROFUN_14327 [Planoprotostelium fungivorum]|uniref:Uncharacterized protein n=1 Tax=Planoprotostelium fungivorum TaxID=1890364 RepID=A0A2P6N0F3_9EUKA|nr:hypothetical protein PROFUN_14327 [Planoprotostelium fungivorum]
MVPVYNTSICEISCHTANMNTIKTFAKFPLTPFTRLIPALSSTLLFSLSFDHAFVTLPPLLELSQESINRSFSSFIQKSLPLLALVTGTTFISGTRAALASPSNSWSRFFFAAGTVSLSLRLIGSVLFARPVQMLMDGEGDTKKNLSHWLIVQKALAIADSITVGLFVTASLK